MSRISARPGFAAERKRLAPHQLDAVVLLRIVRRGNLRATVEAIPRDAEVHHVGRQHPVIDDVRALFACTLDERRGDPRGGEPHVARHPDAPGIEVGDEAAADLPRRLLVHFGGIQSAHVVRFENRCFDAHKRL